MKQVDLNPGGLPSGIVVVKFSTPTCHPCRILTPKFEALDYGDKVSLLSINPIDNPDWMTEENLRAVPITIGFQDNKRIFSVKGDNIDQIKAAIEELI
jgi:thioredoxin-like negative regulator of GroEL